MLMTAILDTEKTNNVKVIVETDGKRKPFTVTLNDFITSFSVASSDDDNYDLELIDVGILPNNCLSAKIDRNSKKDCLSGKVNFVVKKCTSLVSYMGESYIVPFPDLLFSFTFVNGKLKESRVFAMNSKGDICRYPYTNVYSDGKICWGSTKLPVCKNFKDAEQFASLFLFSPGNTDLSNQITISCADKGTMGEVYSLLEGKEEFPDEWLDSSSIRITFDDFCR